MALDHLDQRIAIDHAHRFAYVRIPKAANSTIAALLFSIACGSDPDSTAQAKASFVRPCELSPRKSRDVKRSYFKFTVVRNPFSRVLSAYLEKIVQSELESHAKDAVFSRLRRPHNSKVEFEDFCQYLMDGGLNDDPHWIPQYRFTCLLGANGLDFVGKFETLESDLRNIVSSIFPDYKLQEYQSVRLHRTGASDKLFDYYTPKCEEMVRNLYQEDFRLFNYQDRLRD